VVVSACLLSALVSRIAAALGPGHARLLRLTALVRDQHVRVLARRLARGGRGLLVSDFVSSDTCPALLEAPDEALPFLAERALRERNFFTGTNPLVVRDRVEALAPRASLGVRLQGLWRWHLSATRAYLVYALAFRRR
jgi:hypothetical protein